MGALGSPLSPVFLSVHPSGYTATDAACEAEWRQSNARAPIPPTCFTLSTDEMSATIRVQYCTCTVPVPLYVVKHKNHTFAQANSCKRMISRIELMYDYILTADFSRGLTTYKYTNQKYCEHGCLLPFTSVFYLPFRRPGRRRHLFLWRESSASSRKRRRSKPKTTQRALPAASPLEREAFSPSTDFLRPPHPQRTSVSEGEANSSA